VIGAGVLDTLPAVLARTCPAARYAIIADSQVAEQYGARVRQLVRRQGPVDLFTFPAGEWNKTRAHWSALSDALLAAGAGRDAAIVALGGGVTGDLAGFVAATYLRGIPYVQVPTTLLAMIDSSIGGKTGVDTAFGKNLIGAFHQPRAVVADVATLATLPTPHLAAGLAEAIKHAAIADAAYFDRILALRDELTRRDEEATAAVAARSVEIKVEIVAEDERDRGKRAVLNAGHTMGHAIEAVTGYATLHGEAVGIGLALEAELGSRLGITEPGTDERIRAALGAFGLPVEFPEAPIDDLLDAMRRDKKTRGGAVKFAFLKRIGRMAGGAGGEWTTGASEEAIRAVLAG
jgi:3-dehydroquinate synthase